MHSLSFKVFLNLENRFQHFHSPYRIATYLPVIYPIKSLVIIITVPSLAFKPSSAWPTEILPAFRKFPILFIINPFALNACRLMFFCVNKNLAVRKKKRKFGMRRQGRTHGALHDDHPKPKEEWCISTIQYNIICMQCYMGYICIVLHTASSFGFEACESAGALYRFLYRMRWFCSQNRTQYIIYVRISYKTVCESNVRLLNSFSTL